MVFRMRKKKSRAMVKGSAPTAMATNRCHRGEKNQLLALCSGRLHVGWLAGHTQDSETEVPFTDTWHTWGGAHVRCCAGHGAGAGVGVGEVAMT